MLACVFTDEVERSWANGIAFGGLSFGIIGESLQSIIVEFIVHVYLLAVNTLLIKGLIFVEQLHAK